jgi:hypothetical protein
VPVGDGSASGEPAAVAKARTPDVVVSHQLPTTTSAHPAGAKKKKHKGGSLGSGKPAHEQAPPAGEESDEPSDGGSLLPADLPPVELPPVELPVPVPSIEVPPPPPLPQVPDLPPLPSLTS